MKLFYINYVLTLEKDLISNYQTSKLSETHEFFDEVNKMYKIFFEVQSMTTAGVQQ